MRNLHLSCVWAFWGRKNYGSFVEVLLLALDESNCNQICKGVCDVFYL
jgi:hypothetical protein